MQRRPSPLVAEVSLIVPHNAAFDRTMLKRYTGIFEQERWACSMLDYDWKADGAPNLGLQSLTWAHGYVPQPHRALNDVAALACLLAAAAPDQRRYLTHIYERATAPEVQLILNPNGRYDRGFRQFCREVGFRLRYEHFVWTKTIRFLAEKDEVYQQCQDLLSVEMSRQGASLGWAAVPPAQRHDDAWIGIPEGSWQAFYDYESGKLEVEYAEGAP